MASVNKVILVGFLGKDPEMKLAGASNVTEVSIATTEKWKDQQGNQQEKTEWHNVQFWGKSAEIVHKYTKKGSQIYLEGSLSTQSWDDQATGQKRYKTIIKAFSFQFLGGKGESNASNNSNESNSGGSSYSGASGYSDQSQVPPKQDGFGATTPSDDLPF